jgi:hypothetical protein
MINISNASFTTPPPLIRIYALPYFFKNNLPPIKIIIIFKQKTYKQKHFMNALLIMGWATLATWTIPNTIKDEELRYGLRLVLGSMSIGVLIGALAFCE